MNQKGLGVQAVVARQAGASAHRARAAVRGLRAMLPAAFALAAGACGYSASPALLPQHLKTVAIPVFENATTEYTIEQEITQAVIDRFVRDNHLRIVDEKSANAVVRGKVLAYKNSVFGFTNASQASEYRVSIRVSVVFKDLVKNRELWSEESIEKSVVYNVQDTPGQPARTELDGRKEAISKIADEVLSRSVEGW